MTLSADGFKRARLSEIKLDYDARIADVLGPVNTSPDSVIGQLEGIWAEGIDNVNEALQATYDAMYPRSAEGVSLDGAVSFVGLTRILETSTVVTAAAYGVEGTVIFTGSLARADIQYRSTSDVIISRANAVDITIEVTTVTNSTAYNVLAGGVSATYISAASATSAEIAAGLAALLNVGIFTATATNGVIRLFSSDGGKPFAVTVDSKLKITRLGSPVVFISLVPGANVCPAGALASIDSPVNGWDSVINIVAGVVGRDVETDSSLRLRHDLAIRTKGSATVEAIRSRMIQEVAEVTLIRIYENRTAVTSIDGIPPHAFESVISGGADSDIRAQLWKTKPAGIETYGNVSGLIIDSNGDAQVVKFSRSIAMYGWLNIAVTTYGEEALSPSANLGIKQACVDFAATNLLIGNDVIVQRFIGAIFLRVSGLATITITAALTSLINGTPIYGAANIAIGKAENAIFDISRITVTGV